MDTTDKRPTDRTAPSRELERRLARRFLLGPLVDQVPGVLRYQARRHETGPALDLHLLALKADDEEGNRRFRAGVAGARGLRHSAVQTLIEAGRLDPDHVYALIAAGGSQRLAALVERGPVAPSRAVNILFQVAGALETLHRRGGAYGWLSQAHLSVTPRDAGADEVRLLPVSWLASPGLGVGDRELPPEGEGAGPAGDLWHLGALARRMLSGSPVPAPLQHLIADLLSRDPGARPRSVYEVAVLLRDQGDFHAEPPDIAPPMLVFTPIPASGDKTPVPTQVGSAVAFDVIRDAAPPRRPASLRPAPSRPRSGNTPKPRGTPGRPRAKNPAPPPVSTPKPRLAGPGVRPDDPQPAPTDSFVEEVTTEVTIVPALGSTPAAGPTGMSALTLGILVSIAVLALAALVPLLMNLPG